MITARKPLSFFGKKHLTVREEDGADACVHAPYSRF